MTVSEVLPRERARWHQQHSRKYAGIVQFFSIAVGFIAMTILTKHLGNQFLEELLCVCIKYFFSDH